jgi:outer membrane protein OmpA-like peptidoglycan-associated protein
VGAPQDTNFGFGAAGALAIEIPLASPVGVQAELSTVVLAPGSNDDPSLAPKSTGVGLGAMLGLRLRPLSKKPGGLWIDVNGGLAPTGNAVRPGFDAHVGWDLRVGKGRFDVGPYVGYTHVFEVAGSVRPQDAHILAFGISVGLGASPAAPTDRDGDQVFDDDDACPDTPGVRTTDPRTNGCPRRDRDQDTVYDDEDACPDTQGRRTTDPKTNGCPRLDRDKDTVYDDEDACVDTPGVRTDDPKTNGCPAPDRDADGIADANDACPDLPGIATNDPKTNGCPLSTGPARVTGARIELDEIIHFDTDSPRVRHISWPLVKTVADLINANPDIEEVDIEGHADQTGTPEHNLELSKARAESVKKLLVHFGVADSRVKTHAYGDSHPRAAGSSQEDLRANRRVEFTITRTHAAPKPVTP